jgi:hypothetical protein
MAAGAVHQWNLPSVWVLKISSCGHFKIFNKMILKTQKNSRDVSS